MRPGEWITCSRLVSDALKLVQHLSQVDAIVGVSRSGIPPAGAIATHLHLPMFLARHDGIVLAGNGFRIEGNEPVIKRVAVIDDTAWYGEAMARAKARTEECFPDAEIITAVVYAEPHGHENIDRIVEELPNPHMLEWNFINCRHAEVCATEIDGVLCDPANNRQSISDATPRYIPLWKPVPAIITERSEGYRGETEEWLGRHGVMYERLIMTPPGIDPVRFKAECYRESDSVLFMEWNREKAMKIHRISGKSVLCPDAGGLIGNYRVDG